MKKTFLFLSCMFLLAGIGLFMSNTSGQKQEQGTPTSQAIYGAEKELDFWLLTDPHYIDDELYDEGEAFQFIQSTAAGKDLIYQKESLEAFISEALTAKPNGVIITGDITLNGEYVSGEKFSQLLLPLKKAGISVFVIPGNHDIHNGWARKYSGDAQERIEQIAPADFREIFADYGYQTTYEQDQTSLSYMVPLNQFFNFVFLDTNIYTRDSSTRNPVTAGRLMPETLNWLTSQLRQGQDMGKKTLVFMHHNLFSHNTFVNKGYVLNNADELRGLLAEYQVPVVFSGHIHAQDILTDSETGITEIVTGAFSITPNPYGVVKLTEQKISYRREKTDVDAWAKKNGQTSEALLKHQDYLKELFIRDGEALCYRYLMEAGYYEETGLAEAAAFVGKLNLRFFTGEDSNTEESDQLKESKEYQLISDKSPALQKYIDSILYDTNENDTQFEKRLQ